MPTLSDLDLVTVACRFPNGEHNYRNEATAVELSIGPLKRILHGREQIMSRNKDRIAEQKAIQHLMTFLDSDTKWSSRMNDYMDQMLTPIAEHLNQTVEEVADQLLVEPYVSMAYGFLVDEFVGIQWDNETDSFIETYLKRRGWRESPVGRRYLTKLNDADAKLYEVIHVEPGQSVTLKEYNAKAKPVEVIDQSASETLAKWDCVAGRVMKLHGRYEFSGGLLMLPPEQAKSVAEVTKSAGDELNRLLEEAISNNEIELSDEEIAEQLLEVSLADLPETMFTVWGIFICSEMANELPELSNSDGEIIEIITVQFKLADVKKKIRKALDSSPEFEASSSSSWAWLPRLAKNASLETPSTLLGEIVLTNKHVELHVNSRERAKQGQSLLEDVLGALVNKPLVLHESLESVLAKEFPNDMFESFDPPEDMQLITSGIMDDHYRKTLDEAIPMLGNKSPRECAADPELRHRVVDWLKQLENGASKQGAPYDTSWMWEELSLSRDG